MLLESFLPCVTLYSKSYAKGPIFMSAEEPLRTNVHSPESNGNSNVQSLCIPGPRLVTPSCDMCLAPEFVTAATSKPPIGTGASFVIATVAMMTSSSSSLMSILMLTTSACKEPLLPVVATLIPSPIIPLKQPYLNTTVNRLFILVHYGCLQEATSRPQQQCDWPNLQGCVWFRASKFCKRPKDPMLVLKSE